MFGYEEEEETGGRKKLKIRMKMAVFRVVAPCSVSEIDRHSDAFTASIIRAQGWRQ
jgi:signal transduction histidine kinase